MALAVGDANSGAEFVFPTSEEVGHPINGYPSNQRLVGQVEARDLPSFDLCSPAGVATLHLPYGR